MKQVEPLTLKYLVVEVVLVMVMLTLVVLDYGHYGTVLKVGQKQQLADKVDLVV